MTPDTPTENRPTDSEDSTDRPRMGGVDHTHPERNTTFGSIFGRGPSVAADGGEPAPAPEAGDDDDAAMEDVDHDAPSETGPNATFERGAEHAAESDPADAADPADVTDPVDEAPTDE
ncbi:hypothetical protein GCM10028857_10700 [Salinarchaeum chitinilyticum]